MTTFHIPVYTLFTHMTTIHIPSSQKWQNFTFPVKNLLTHMTTVHIPSLHPVHTHDQNSHSQFTPCPHTWPQFTFPVHTLFRHMTTIHISRSHPVHTHDHSSHFQFTTCSHTWPQFTIPVHTLFAHMATVHTLFTHMTTVHTPSSHPVLICPFNVCTKQTAKIFQHEKSYRCSKCVSQQVIIIVLVICDRSIFCPILLWQIDNWGDEMLQA
jgi:hypothetical protein